jgi:hypothetical protein
MEIVVNPPRIRAWIRKAQEMRASATGAPAATNSKSDIQTYLENGAHSLSSDEITTILAEVSA